MQSLSAEEKYNLLLNCSKLSSDFQCPLNTYGRKFLHSWLIDFPWLSYSKSLDGAFCFYCVLFAPMENSHNSSKLVNFWKSPFTNWSNGPNRFRAHCEKSPLHRTATVMTSHFRPIDRQLNNMVDDQVSLNRGRLEPIVGGVIYFGRQNVSLRGHRDDSQHYDQEDINPGNLQELLKYLVRYGKNSLFENHMLNAPKSATYRSKPIQNELISICEGYILEKLTDEIKASRYFSVLADEATDTSNREQMALVIRFVDSKSEIREVFVGFFECNEGISGEAISKKILEGVEKLSLDMRFCRGQGYDGTGNMAGKCSGAAARIQRMYPDAPYVHCGAHILNLCVAKACSIQVVSNMMGQVRVVSEFFNNSPKRFSHLEGKIKELSPTARHTHLIDVCRTRWLARIDGLDIFNEIFMAIVLCLEAMSFNENSSWNADTLRDAGSLFLSITSFQFVICLVVVSRCLEVTRPLTKQLQSISLDALATNSKVALLNASLQRLRNEKSVCHQQWFSEAEELARSVGVDPARPRTVPKQANRENVPAESVSQYYERIVTLPFLDHLITQIQTRFSNRNLTALNGFYAFPSKVVSAADWKEKLMIFLERFVSDLPEPRYLSTELRMWEDHCYRLEGKPAESVSDLLPTIDRVSFPNIYTAMQILATLPVTTCTCERSISVLRRLKTYLRSTMTANRMNGLALLHVHRDIEVDTDEIIRRFALRHPRRMKLLDILNTDPK